MTGECPQCNAPLSRQASRYCNQCGADLRPNEDVSSSATDISTPPAFPAPAENSPDSMPPDMLTTDPIPAAPVADGKPTLRILLRDGSVIERELSETETKIGKGPQNQIILADPAVSTTHAAIRREADGYLLTDLGSRNGTFLNETRITDPHPLKHGDVIKMGRCTLTLRIAAASQTVMLDRPPVPAPAHHTAQPVTEDELAAAFVSGGLIDAAQVERLRGPEAKGRRLVRALVEEKVVSDTDLRDLISSRFGIPLVDIQTLKPDAAVATALTPTLLRERLVLPASARPDLLPLVVADPSDAETIERVKKAARRPVELRLAAAGELAAQLDQLFAPRLVGVLATGEKIEKLITQQEVEVGKAPHNQIVLNYPTVSSTHAIILARDGGYSIVDLGSSNGTFVNGQRLGDQPHTLQHGDKIQIAEVLFTYRNPAETTENKTARLSPEILEEVRRRAGLPSNVSASMPAAALAVGAGAAAGAAVEKKEKKKDKDKDVKKKDDDRMKAALLNSTSRLLATVLSSILTIAGTLYLVKWTQTSSSSSTSGGGGGGKPAQSKFAAPGSFAAIQGGTFETSGAVWIPDTNTVLLVDDGKPGQLLLMTLDEAGRQSGALTPVNLGAQVIDPEAITYDGAAWFYIISSQGDPNQGAQNGLLRFAWDRQTRTVRGTPEVIPDLRGFLLSQLPELHGEGEKAGNKGGLNIEGMTWDADNSRLLLGLRGPLINGRAVIVPLKLKDPLGAFTKENLQLASQRTIQLELGGQGIRDLDYIPQLRSYLILSGATELSEKTDFGLWEWNGDPDQSKPEAHPRRDALLDEKAKPEGITNVTINGKSFVLVVGDASRYLKLDPIGNP
jgi:pSer/pThr/pTyr-binding forkhead associated (FHA) protein